MKLLLDQNLSHRLVSLLARAFPGIQHVVEVGLADSDDETIWRFARNHGWVIVSKDSDFLYRSMVRGHPPKVIQMKVGNRSTDAIATLFLGKKAQIRAFLKQKNESILILD